MNAGRRILVVDDEDGLRTSLAANLELEGYEVHEAESGRRAVELVREQPFDLVITDVRMPGMNGVETFREIRKIRPGTVVMMMTAFAIERLIEQALDEGVYTVVTKPFAIDRIMEMIARTLARPMVLVVDDVVEHADVIVQAFRDIGLSAEAASDGPSAVRCVSAGSVDVCVLDLVMPGMDGAATYEEIRRLDPTIPVIALSGYSVPEMMHRIMQMGGYACMRKPVDVRELIRTIARARAAPVDMASLSAAGQGARRSYAPEEG